MNIIERIVDETNKRQVLNIKEYPTKIYLVNLLKYKKGGNLPIDGILVFVNLDMNFDIFWTRFSNKNYFEWFTGLQTKEKLRKVLIWKRLLSYSREGLLLDKIWEDYLSNNFESYSVITYAFLKHLKYPKFYPIFDRHVWDTVRYLRTNIKRKTEKEREKKNYEIYYVPFFNNLYERIKERTDIPYIKGIDRIIVVRALLDRALWMVGKILEGQNE
jgi:hypothetical protein